MDKGRWHTINWELDQRGSSSLWAESTPPSFSPSFSPTLLPSSIPSSSMLSPSNPSFSPSLPQWGPTKQIRINTKRFLELKPQRDEYILSRDGMRSPSSVDRSPCWVILPVGHKRLFSMKFTKWTRNNCAWILCDWFYAAVTDSLFHTFSLKDYLCIKFQVSSFPIFPYMDCRREKQPSTVRSSR